VEGITNTGEIRNAYEVLVGKIERKIILGENRYRWKNNIKICPTEKGLKYMDWINLV
jgi:hypothetical protein